MVGIPVDAFGDPIRVQGFAVLARTFKAAAPELREKGIELRISSEGGSKGGIAALAEDRADIALSARTLTPEERASAPNKQFPELRIGTHAFVVAVARDVAEGGVEAVSRGEMREIYEGRVRNWKELGGPDQAIKFYSPEPGSRAWEALATWLYGDSREANPSPAENLPDSESARDAMEFNAGSISVLPLSFVDGKSIHSLGIRGDSGTIVKATPANIFDGVYPMSRPLFCITAQRPAGDVRRVLEFLSSSSAHAILNRTEVVPVEVAFRLDP